MSTINFFFRVAVKWYTSILPVMFMMARHLLFLKPIGYQAKVPQQRNFFGLITKQKFLSSTTKREIELVRKGHNNLDCQRKLYLCEKRNVSKE